VTKRRAGAATLAAFTLVAGLTAIRAERQLTRPEAQRILEAATTHFTASRYREALAAFDEATRSADPDLATDARKGVVRAALRLAEFDTAARTARVLADEPEPDDQMLALYGDAQWGLGLFDEAEAAYTRALDRNPRSSRARFGLARALATRSRLADALGHVQQAQIDDPSDPDVYALTGAIHERLNHFEAAADAYTAYASRVPPNEPTPAAVARGRAEFLRSFRNRVPMVMDDANLERPYSMPFKLVRNKVVVQGRLNGVPVDWVLDTGAERVGVTFDVAARARLQPVTSTITAGVGRSSLRQVRLARAESLEVGPLRIRQVPVSVRNPAANGAPRWQSQSLSPLALGLSSVVDYPARRITLARALPEPAAGTRLPLRVHRLPFVRGTVNASRPVYFVVDTGGELMSLSTDVAAGLNMTPPRHIPLRVLGMSGPDEEAYVLPGVDLDFAEIGYRRFGLAVLNLRAPSVLLGFQVGGIVGHKFLGGYRVSMDLPRSELTLERAARAR
jgi:Flp pilus assembly protein TadD